MPKGFLGTARGELRVRIRDLGIKKIRNAFAFRITFWLPHGQRLRNAPCGRFSEQSLAPRSKIARRMPKGFLGTARGELRVRIRDLGIKKIRNAFAFRITFWLPHEDSNPDKQSQSLPCYRYTIGQYLTCFTIIFIFCPFVNRKFKIFQNFLQLSTKVFLCIIILM